MADQAWRTRITVGDDGRPIHDLLRYIPMAPNPFLSVPTTGDTAPQFPRTYYEPLTPGQRAALRIGVKATAQWFRENPGLYLDASLWLQHPADPLAPVRQQLQDWLAHYRPRADIPLPPTPAPQPVPEFGPYTYAPYTSPFKEEPPVAEQDKPTPSDLDADWPHPRTLTVQVDGVSLSECSITGIKIERQLMACDNPECSNCTPTEKVVITADVNGPALP